MQDFIKSIEEKKSTFTTAGWVILFCIWTDEIKNNLAQTTTQDFKRIIELMSVVLNSGFLIQDVARDLEILLATDNTRMLTGIVQMACLLENRIRF
jgi:hypothetical protein